MPENCPLAFRIGFIKPMGGTTIKFQFMPEDISDNKSANYNETEILARSHPLMGYSSSGARQLSFTLQFYKTGTFDPLDVTLKLRALCYAQYADNVSPPPVCIVAIGKIKMKGVMMNCDITYKHPWDVDEDSPMYAEVSLTFSEVNEVPWSYAEVAAGLDMVSL